MSFDTLARVKIGATVIPATGVRIQDGVTTANLQLDSDSFQRAILASTGAVRIMFTAPLKNALDAFGLAQSALVPEIYFGKVTDGIVAANGTKWALTAGASAVGMISSISVSNAAMATAECMLVVFSSDGATDPLTETTAVALPALAAPVAHTLGAVSLNGTALVGADNLSYQAGWNVTELKTDADTYTRDAFISAAPSVTLDHTDIEGVRGITGGGGAALATGGLSVTLAAVDHTSGILSGTDLTLAVAAGHVAPNGITAEQAQIGRQSITVTPTSSDGVTNGVVNS